MSNALDREWRRQHPVAFAVGWALGMTVNLAVWAVVIWFVGHVVGVW
jgi:hypothetical protein